ncbi:MAG: hypothetical protein AB1796_01630 [Bacillota bacterium]
MVKPGGRAIICHPAARETINNLHSCLGGVVAGDLWAATLSKRGRKKFKQGLDSDFHQCYLLVSSLRMNLI